MKVKELVAEGRIGEVYLARAFEGVNEIPNRLNPKAWHDTPDRAGGGVVLDMGVHFAALLRWILGDIERVRACYTDKIVIKTPNKAEDNAIILMTFKNGAMAEIVVTNTMVSPPFNRFELYGTEGTIFEDHSQEKPVTVFTNKPGYAKSFDWDTPEVEHETYPGYYVISFRNEVQHFVDCILEDKMPRMLGEDGKVAVEMMHMGYMAEKTGKSITRNDLYSDAAKKLGIK
jgi:predicted dehydrogenase